MTATINGLRCTSVRVFVPYVGPWFADVAIDGATGLTGRVTISYGALSLVGTIDPTMDGSQSDQQVTRVVAGGGGWARALVPKSYANDAGVKALLVAQDAAREAGETLGTFAPAAPMVGTVYVRQSGSAARALEDVCGSTPWWVDYDGVTQVGVRPTVAAAVGSYEVLELQPRDHLVELALDDMTKVTIGSILTDRLDAPQTVRGIEIRIDADTARMFAWCGTSGRERIAELMRTIARRSTDDRLYGKYRYRVGGMEGDRVQLQAVSIRAGLPDILRVPMWPGVAGVHATLTASAEVLVEFIEGSRTMPIVTGFVGKGGPGFVPTRIEIANAGPDVAPAAARVGDEVQVTFDAGTFMTSAQSPVYNTVPLTFTGTITAGSSKVGIG